ncbi:hypothetical protein JFN85_02695 [Enterobacter hormaechei subsp. xiangfangensis]|uniref:hypothetical protein n=1 Tax=Enterobacter hormaechei TaxID=158836 RepID=UPI001EFAE21A|nr:hypothetical protein [Enterobacter hormaechei]ULQ27275.1 hypothetical protein JFN83_02590 [Enterobacter hormaechei subsp. xiangfangensis]ULQ32185.1 hypothetical protein JFN85_02695 [Enterobacter hormaechei subsp. xiangfangensis]
MSNDDKLLRLFSYFSRSLVAGARKKSVTRFSENLENLDFLVRGFTPAASKTPASATTPAIPATSQLIDMLMIDDVKFGKFIAGEAHKFFLAAMVSLERSRQVQQHNLSWQVVEHYYAAYYAVHYLMRIFGYSLTNIDDKAIKKIKEGSVVPMDGIRSGLSTIEFSIDCKEVIITKNEKGGGSHKDAWAIWIKILSQLIVECEKDHGEYSSLEIDLLAHKSFIAINDQKFNPSEIRGEVNYQFKGNSWCFEDDTNVRLSLVTKEIMKDDYNLTDAQDKILKLINNNKFIISLARRFFEYSSAEYKNGICRSLQNQFKNKIATII